MTGVKGRSGGDRPGSGRPRKPRQKLDGSEDQLAKKASKLAIDAFLSSVLDAPAEIEKIDPAQLRLYQDPRELLIDIMNADIDVKVRLEAAKTLMPFEHPKKAELGKKEEKNQRAATVARGKFAPSAPPKLAVDNTKK